MRSPILFPTILISLITLSGCASLMGEPSDEEFDTTPYSQAASERWNGDSERPQAANPSSEDYRHNYVSPAIENHDIVPGMTSQEVVSAWGRPREVDVAGDGSRGNERWTYFTDNSLRYGIAQQKIIYFEDGRVTGWETR